MEKLLIVEIIVILGLGIWSICIARKSIDSSRKTAREKNTLDFVNKYNESREVFHALKFIRDNKTKSDDEKRAAVEIEENRGHFLYLMNMLEVLAIGLEQGIYDEDVVRKVYGYELANIYLESKFYIDDFRKENEGEKNRLNTLQDDGAFAEFEKLYNKMKEEKHGKSNRN